MTPPYGPWRDRSSDGSPGPITHILCLLVSQVAQIKRLRSPAELFERVWDFLASTSRRQPLLLVLEDLHWSDPASLNLVRFIGQQIEEFPILLIVTYRTDELHRHHLLSQLLPALVREANANRIELRPLEKSALRAIVQDRYQLPDEAVERLVKRLSKFAEGNPFYVREMLRDLEEERVLRPGERHWTLGNLDRTGVPSLVRQVLDGRIDRLGEVNRDRLSVAAVIGQEIPLALWQGVIDAGEEDLLRTIERASEAKLLDVTG